MKSALSVSLLTLAASLFSLGFFLSDQGEIRPCFPINNSIIFLTFSPATSIQYSIGKGERGEGGYGR